MEVILKTITTYSSSKLPELFCIPVPVFFKPLCQGAIVAQWMFRPMHTKIFNTQK